jgi:YHS domain-containing protein
MTGTFTNKGKDMHRFLTLIIAALMTTATALAAEPSVYTGLLSNTGAGGYDTVSYFEEGEPVKGSTEFTTQYRGATWRFANAENLARFKALEHQAGQTVPELQPIGAGHMAAKPRGVYSEGGCKLAEGSGIVSVWVS